MRQRAGVGFVLVVLSVFSFRGEMVRIHRFSAYPQRGPRLPYATLAIIVTPDTSILQSSPSRTRVGDGEFYSWNRCSRTSLHYGACSTFQAFGPHSVPRPGAILGPKYVSQFSSNDRSDKWVEERTSRHFVSGSRLFGTIKASVGHHKADSIVTEPIRQLVEDGARPAVIMTKFLG